ncbi:MAG: pseudouridine synthase [Bacteroidota bacterium]|nr:pseudouridine synthase [Bacteroidota bacterium]
MAKTTRLRTFIARHFNLMNEEADLMIGQGRVRVNGIAQSPATKIESYEEVSVDGKIIREAFLFSYVKFYKPRGIECTLNPEIENNLLTVFHFPKKLFPVGRLDKESEGLLLMTDDGKIFKDIAWTESGKEKEYLVSVNKTIDELFLKSMREGIVIMGKTTRPADVIPVTENQFRIILTQGLNRQIRRMCYKLGYEVEELIRVRIANVELRNLKSGAWEELKEEEKTILLTL